MLKAARRLERETPQGAGGLSVLPKLTGLIETLERLVSFTEAMSPSLTEWRKDPERKFELTLPSRAPAGEGNPIGSLVVQSTLPSKQHRAVLAWAAHHRLAELLTRAGLPNEQAARAAREGLRVAGFREKYDPGWKGTRVNQATLEMDWQGGLEWLARASQGGPQQSVRPETLKALLGWREYFRRRWQRVEVARESRTAARDFIQRDLAPLLSQQHSGEPLTPAETDLLIRRVRNGASTCESLAVVCLGLRAPRLHRTLRRLAKT